MPANWNKCFNLGYYSTWLKLDTYGKYYASYLSLMSWEKSTCIKVALVVLTEIKKSFSLLYASVTFCLWFVAWIGSNLSDWGQVLLLWVSVATCLVWSGLILLSSVHSVDATPSGPLLAAAVGATLNRKELWKYVVTNFTWLSSVSESSRWTEHLVLGGKFRKTVEPVMLGSVSPPDQTQGRHRREAGWHWKQEQLGRLGE